MKTLLSLALTLATTAIVTAQQQQQKPETISNIVVFGDSYSDVGNKQRLTNGPLWSEDLAVGWNASLYSFAFSGAVCNNDMYSKETTFIPSITDQVEMYYNQNLDLNPEETAFIFWVGVNDVYKIFENQKNHGGSIEAEFKKVVECIGSNVRNVRRVFSQNKFIVFGVPPLELMPYYANTEEAPSREQAANTLNELLTKDVEKMNKHLQSLELDLVDVHKLLDDIVEKPELFDLKNAVEPYWDACQGKCTDEMDTYVWWDKTHLTGGIHRLIANSILMAGSLAPETYLEDDVDVDKHLEKPHSHYKSPKYKAKKNTGAMGKIIQKLNDEKAAKEGGKPGSGHSNAEEDISEVDGELKIQNPDKASRSFIFFGIIGTIIVSVGFFLFVKNKRRAGGQLAALSGLLKNKSGGGDRGRFMPLRNLDSEV